MSTWSGAVAVGTDDGGVTTAGVTSLTGSLYAIGTNYGLVRIPSIAIPQGSAVISAELTVRLQVTASTPTVDIRASAADDVPALVGALASNPQTAAVGSVVVLANGFHTVDVTDVVQEILDRPGWIAGSAIAFLLARVSSGTVALNCIEGNATYAAVLEVEYSDDAPPGVAVSSIEASSEGALPNVRVMELEVFTDAPPPVAGPAKVWTGDQWTEAIPHVWTGDQWVPVQPYVWTGDQWVPTA